MKVTKQLVNAVLTQASKAALQQYFFEVFSNENRGYGDDMRSMNLLLTGEFKTPDDFCLEAILPNLDKHIYRYEENKIHDVCIKRVYNISACIYIGYKDDDKNYEHEVTIDFETYERYYKEFVASNAVSNTGAE